MIVLQVIIHTAGILVAVAAISAARSLIRGEVTTARRPLYFYRGAVQTVLFAIYADYLVREMWGVRGLPEGLTAFGSAAVFLLIGLDWMVTWTIDRNEYRQVLKAEAARLLEMTAETEQ